MKLNNIKKGAKVALKACATVNAAATFAAVGYLVANYGYKKLDKLARRKYNYPPVVNKFGEIQIFNKETGKLQKELRDNETREYYEDGILKKVDRKGIYHRTITEYPDDNSDKSRVETSFDIKPDGSEIYSDTRWFNKDGRVSRKKSEYSDISFSYDGDGNIIRETDNNSGEVEYFDENHTRIFSRKEVIEEPAKEAVKKVEKKWFDGFREVKTKKD